MAFGMGGNYGTTGTSGSGSGLSGLQDIADRKKKPTAVRAPATNTGTITGPAAGLTSQAAAGQQISPVKPPTVGQLASGAPQQQPPPGGGNAEITLGSTPTGFSAAEHVKGTTQEGQLGQPGAPGGAPPPAAPGSPESDPASDVDALYNDMMEKQNQSWQQTQQLLQAQAAANQRRAQSMQGALGRSVAGGFAGAIGQAGILSGQQMQQAALQNQEKQQRIMMDQIHAKTRASELKTGREFTSDEASKDRAHRMDMMSAELEALGGDPDEMRKTITEAIDEQGLSKQEVMEKLQSKYGLSGAPLATAMEAAYGKDWNPGGSTQEITEAANLQRWANG